MKWKTSDHRQAEVTASQLINIAGDVRTHQHPAVQQAPGIWRGKFFRKVTRLKLELLGNKILRTQKESFGIFSKAAVSFALIIWLHCCRKTFLPFQHNLVPLIPLLNNRLSFYQLLRALIHQLFADQPLNKAAKSTLHWSAWSRSL